MWVCRRAADYLEAPDLKFFTHELWQALQGRDSDLAEREWSKRSTRYLAQLAKLKGQLSEPVYRFITTKGLHDLQLTSIDVARQGRLGFVLSRSGSKLLLELSGVKKWIVEYADSKQSLELGRPFEWGYEEFSAAGAKAMQLDVLFSSGGRFTVQFTKIRIRAIRGK
jgi:hypothetical protein